MLLSICLLLKYLKQLQKIRDDLLIQKWKKQNQIKQNNEQLAGWRKIAHLQIEWKMLAFVDK